MEGSRGGLLWFRRDLALAKEGRKEGTEKRG